LNIGENNFSLSVTSANGAQQSTYAVKVIRLQYDFVFELLSAANQTSNMYYFSAPNNVKLYIQDMKRLTYRLTTGNTSGDVLLRFAAGSKTLDKTVTVQSNHIYEMDVLIWINKTGIYSNTHFDAYGRPSYAEIIYPNRAVTTITISDNDETLISSQTELLGASELIEFLSIVSKGTNSIAEMVVEQPRPAGYYSLQGLRLAKEPESGLYIIQYDNGTAKKAFKKK
jgi:hypothetical protein